MMTLSVFSPNAVLWSSLFYLFLVLGAGTATLVLGYMVFLVARNREKPDHGVGGVSATGSGSTRRFLFVLVVISLTIGSTLYVSLGVATDPYFYPPTTGQRLVVDVYAFQWGWNFTYPNGVSLIDTLRVPVNTTILLNVTSKDVFHSLGIPMLDVKADAIPGAWNQVWFLVAATGNYTDAIRCYELCGVGHSFMVANLIVMQPSAFYQWYNGST
jgi:cytochrome c oxidase subunit 2